MSAVLLITFLALAFFAQYSCRKADGNTQKGVDASVKAAAWGVLALVALAYLVGWA